VNSQRVYTKTFVEHVYAERLLLPGRWNIVPRGTTGETPLDKQVQQWVDETNAVIVSTSPPGIAHTWLDGEMQLRCTTLAITVIYLAEDPSNGDAQPGNKSGEPGNGASDEPVPVPDSGGGDGTSGRPADAGSCDPG